VTEGIRRHVERELARARAAPRGGIRQAVAAPIAQRVVDVLRRVPRGQELAWDIDISASLTVDADAQDLTEMLGNLAENAMKWARQHVRLAGRREAGGAVLLSVEDDGPGIPEAEAATALARGGRLDGTKPGTGLGLAIVGDLAGAYGGSLSLGRSVGLAGLRAEIRLPSREEEAGMAVRPARTAMP
jgi:signal transduction histidine kinase